MKSVVNLPPLGVASCALVCSLFAVSAFAAPVPEGEAGRNLQELRQPLAPQAQPIKPAPLMVPALPDEGEVPDASLQVSHITITGNSVFSTAELNALVAHLQGKEVSLAELQAGVRAITAHYRQQGYLVARAYLPQQEVAQGEVTIAVLEGVLSELVVHNNSQVSDRLVRGILERNVSLNQPLKTNETNRALLLLQSIPGVDKANGGLLPGAEQGSTTLNVAAMPAPRVNGLVRLDNYGNQYTGRYRLTGLVNVNNLAGMGDKLSVQGVVSEDDGLDYGRLAWDAPVGYSGLRLGASASNTRYELGKDYKTLDAYGEAQTFALYGNYPVLLATSYHLNVGLSLEQRQLQDKIDQQTPKHNSKKTAQAAVLSVDGDRHDNWLWGGANAFRLSATLGDLSMKSDDAKLADDFSKTAGNYSKVELSATRLQQLPAKFSVYAAGNVQWASKNLDSSEALFLGGANGIRAYPQGEGAGDEGWMVNVELRYTVLAGLQAKVFHDEGEVTINKKPNGAAGSNHYHIGGTGLGVDAQWRQLNAGIAAAWRSTDKPQADKDDKPRVWGQISWQF